MRTVSAITLLLLAFTAQADPSFQLTSPDIKTGTLLNNAQVFNGFGCNGGNISPQLNWSGAPENTKSFAVTVYDPDAPTGSGWWHWVIFNIPANAVGLARNAGNPTFHLAPEGSVQSRTDFGTAGFGGACPPKGHGKHRYQFKVHALDIERLDIGLDSSGALAGYYLNAHQLDVAEIEAIYERVAPPPVPPANFSVK
ncbi:MAG: YbhB/YbcL family Raf kinase inhibitor-like protein [gamma proteobacterium endosymbiont of Lamellibrachia anaximandri]|nr:YbhB/YbcL family Raf kinase inhibitor-like protein [gamma proteobacterium endosymbiont of Lamellibrachia anaximandri]MBL3616786.1 YbhB/YbcL family Raf kinase inhibitor-like protein [gamma proteobacterium endosymbiont of Lamellibrachia anaximandri]